MEYPNITKQSVVLATIPAIKPKKLPRAALKAIF